MISQLIDKLSKNKRLVYTKKLLINMTSLFSHTMQGYFVILVLELFKKILYFVIDITEVKPCEYVI
jgi:hypothetical protein